MFYTYTMNLNYDINVFSHITRPAAAARAAGMPSRTVGQIFFIVLTSVIRNTKYVIYR